MDARLPAMLKDAAVTALDGLTGWTVADIEAALKAALVEALGLKPRKAFGPIRVGITGSLVSPPLFESMELLGRERSLQRLREARDGYSENGLRIRRGANEDAIVSTLQ